MKKWIKNIGISLAIVAAFIAGQVSPITQDIAQNVSNHLPSFAQQIVHRAVKDVLTIGMAGVTYAAAPDYTANGTADSTPVQNALNALPSTGGKIIIYGGNYTFTATVSRAINNVTIEGSGKSTYIAYNASSPVFSAGSQTGWVFQDLRTDAGFITLSSASDTVLLNIWDNTSYIDKTTGSGTTMPVAPAVGQQFLQIVTGRRTLYQYDGVNWNVLYQLDNTILYVDTASGTDDLNHGYGTGSSAFKTINYTFQFVQVPYSGDVDVYISAGTYTESLTIPSVKPYSPTGYVKYHGTLTSTANLTATGGTAGGAGGHPTVTGTFTAGAYDAKLIKFTSGTNNNTYAIVGQTTTTTLWLDSDTLPAAPANNDTYSILDWGTIISGNSVIGPGARYGIWDIAWTASSGPYALSVWGGATVAHYRCKFTTTGATEALSLAFGVHNLWWSVIQTTSAGKIGLLVVEGADVEVNAGNLFIGVNNGDVAIYIDSSLLHGFGPGNEIKTWANGIYTILRSSGNCWTSTTLSYIHGCGYGFQVTGGGYFTNTTANTYIKFGVKLDGTADANTNNYNIAINTLSPDGTYIGG